MKKENFGKLLKALRKERNEDGLLDQKGLAEQLSTFPNLEGITPTVISTLERGKRLPTKTELIALAKVFEMSTAERREFILAANDVDTKYLVSEQSDSQRVFEWCKSVVGSMQSPAILIDQYFDLIGFNKATALAYGLAKEEYSVWKDAPHPTNIVDVMMNDAIQRNASYKGQDDREFVLREVLHYRARSLPYRHHPYFIKQLKRLKRSLPGFKSIWRQAQTTPDMEDSFMGRDIRIKHAKYGRLIIRGSSMLFPTFDGNLEIIIQTPADEFTRDTMLQLMKNAESGYIELYRWPDKPE